MLQFGVNLIFCGIVKNYRQWKTSVFFYCALLIVTFGLNQSSFLNYTPFMKSIAPYRFARKKKITVLIIFYKVWWHISASKSKIFIVLILENFHDNSKVP